MISSKTATTKKKDTAASQEKISKTARTTKKEASKEKASKTARTTKKAASQEKTSKTARTTKKAASQEKTSKTARTTKKAAFKEKASKTAKVFTDLDFVECVAEAMSEKKGGHILSMDLRGIPGASFDFFVVCEATSGPQVRAIADEIEDQAWLRFRMDPLHKEGYANAEWILMDFGGVVAHVFLDSVRAHYKLEELWGDSGIRHFNEED